MHEELLYRLAKFPGLSLPVLPDDVLLDLLLDELSYESSDVCWLPPEERPPLAAISRTSSLELIIR